MKLGRNCNNLVYRGWGPGLATGNALDLLSVVLDWIFLPTIELVIIEFLHVPGAVSVQGYNDNQERQDSFPFRA